MRSTPSPNRNPARPWSDDGRRRLLFAWLVAAFLVLSSVAPALAGSGPTALSDAAVSPRSGTPTTLVAVSVRYRNREGSPADWVRVTVAGRTYAMARTSGDDWKRGVTFGWSGRLPAGQHAVSIEAMSRDRFSDSIGAGSVTITAPTPKPTPKPTPAPTPKPTPKPTPLPTPAPTPTSTTPAPTVVQTPPGSAAPGGSGSTPTTEPAGGSPPPGGATPSASDGPRPSDGAVAVVPGGPDTGTPDGGPTSGGGPRAGSGGPSDIGPMAVLASAVGLIATERPSLPLGLTLTLATTSTVVGAALAFGLFGKRRRDGDPPESDEALAGYAASGLTVASVNALAAAGSDDPPPAPEGEMAMPRWRRPSLLEARRADPIRDPTPAPPLTFDHGLVGPLDGRERRLIRYSLVRLLDQPDELRGAEIAFLDRDDEVQLLEKRGVYWLVLCPDGRQGWIHKMTLGDPVEPSPRSSSPTATMPLDADTWTMGGDVDGDVLAAYLESRRRG